MKAVLILAAGLALASCNRQAEQPAPVAPTATITPAQAAPSATFTMQAGSPQPASLAPPSTSRDPALVLNAWARAIALRDWALVRAYWGDHGARSGLSETEFAARWHRLKNPTVALSQGDQEGAAGSLYYTAPVTITDGGRTLRGEIVLRRVNDVDGASAEQLRWHIESLSIEP